MKIKEFIKLKNHADATEWFTNKLFEQKWVYNGPKLTDDKDDPEDMIYVGTLNSNIEIWTRAINKTDCKNIKNN